MPENQQSAVAAVGFRVKSGWATVVLITGPIQSPRVLDRRRIELCDPAIPESRQPYHAGMGRLEADEMKVKRRCKVVLQAANSSAAALMRDYGNAGHRVRAVGLVVGSDIDPARVANPHIRAHALEGRLFRTVLEDAVRSWGLPCSVFLERNVYSWASQVLQRSEDDLKRCVAELGRSLGRPWRADEKTASLAAWLTLA